MRALFLSILFVTVGAAASPARGGAPSADPKTVPVPAPVETFTKTPIEASEWTTVTLGAIDPHVFDLALSAARCAVRSGAIDDPSARALVLRPAKENPS